MSIKDRDIDLTDFAQWTPTNYADILCQLGFIPDEQAETALGEFVGELGTPRITQYLATFAQRFLSAYTPPLDRAR